jgi:hypothetical protein
MDNPFKKRKTELIPDRRTLLSWVSATPLEEFFSKDRAQLIEKLTLVVGTPGCGKTTIAQVVEFESLAILCASPMPETKNLIDVLTRNELIKDGVPAVLGHWLQMSVNFRDIWELPYSEHMRTTLLRAFMQAKAVLGWFRQLEAIDIQMSDIEIVLGVNSESLASVTRADDPIEFRAYARRIELAIYQVVTALVPPDEQGLADNFLNTSYDVFEVLKGFKIKEWPERPGQGPVTLRPMMIVDDAHELHPIQFVQIRDWLKSKAIGVSRWLLCRPDVVAAEDYRDALASDAETDVDMTPGSTKGRDYLIKLMQFGRGEKRFQGIARDIADRYVTKIPEFSRREINRLAPMLDMPLPPMPDGQIKVLEAEVAKLAKDSKFSLQLMDSLRARLPAEIRPEEHLVALRILMHRERNRTPQLGLLDDDEELDEPVTQDRPAKSSLIDGARIQLMNEFERPYYYGMNKVTGASNSNIEQFIRLAGVLVDELLAQVIRGRRSAELAPKAQHIALVKEAHQVMKEWDFPYHSAVRQLVTVIAKRCKERTMLPNAPLTAGANAVGVLQDEMDGIFKKHERLSRVLHFAFAYKALVYVPQYGCKGKVWCLLELGAVPCMAHGLRLNRGGFIEETLRGVDEMLPAEGA